MATGSDAARLRRIKVWIGIFSFLPAAVFGFLANIPYASGFFLGGILVLFNFVGTERVVRSFVEGTGVGRVIVPLLQFAKLGLTAAIIGGVLYLKLVSPFALLLGLSTLFVALLFDFFLFPVNKGEEKET
ncbi:MAG: hypothetical protein JSV26_01105 [bacterium]|nr:MAG: hypothetical protein JSV26_01105 [bacterium]